jgi:hypothetical protein
MTARPQERSSTVLIVSGAVSAMTVVTDLNLRAASSSGESTRYASEKHTRFPRALRRRKRLSDSMIFLRPGPGKPSQCLPIAAAQLTPVNMVPCPVALCGGPATPRHASIGFECADMRRHSAGHTSGFTGLSVAASLRPTPSMNRKSTFIPVREFYQIPPEIRNPQRPQNVMRH